MSGKKESPERFFVRQMESWPLAARNYRALQQCRHANLTVKGTEVTVMYNPGRIRSSSAAVDSSSIASRPCFLCGTNRPEEQLKMDLGDYELLVNPFPIFERHFTIAGKRHMPQQIAGRVSDMLRIASSLGGMTVFYNAPQCGASAPDHLHFQAVPSDELPLMRCLDAGREWKLGQVEVVEGADVKAVAERTEGKLWTMSAGKEPAVNLYARQTDRSTYQMVIVPRTAHRPRNYGTGDGQVLVSPASAEMAGVIVAPREADFDYCLDPARVEAIFAECGVPAGAGPEVRRELKVGIVKARQLEVTLQGDYTSTQDVSVSLRERLHLTATTDGKIDCNGVKVDSLFLRPLFHDDRFMISDVVIGIDFHWQQYENQTFHGALLVEVTGRELQAVNVVDVETYLRSVVSSEMNAAAPEEFLKAHAVISRSWVLAQIMPPAHLASHDMTDTAGELIKWYDREAHTGFDVCADDHCQRYQGCTKASTPQVEAALQATHGLVLAYGNDLCDARFSKCCGGVSELFSTCWQNVDLPYLQAVDDPFCGRATKRLLRLVLNDYDRATEDYYEWKVSYTAGELADIVHRRTGLDYGDILSITPLHRGPSGRIDRLELRGTKLTRVIGKELEIRRTLSETHFYSSAFTVEAHYAGASDTPQSWTFRGRGWGHGVGLCQIGAAQMASEGYDYRQILKFYFPGARLIKLYD